MHMGGPSDFGFWILDFGLSGKVKGSENGTPLSANPKSKMPQVRRDLRAAVAHYYQHGVDRGGLQRADDLLDHAPAAERQERLQRPHSPGLPRRQHNRCSHVAPPQTTDDR